jgi:hypothetical protein
MSSDPFERGRASGQATADSEKQSRDDYLRRCDEAAAKFYPMLKPKFEPHGYSIRYWIGSGKYPGGLRIWPSGWNSDTEAPFEVSGSYFGRGYSVKSHWESPYHSVHERDCGAERVLELAGDFFGRSIDFQTRQLNAEREKNARPASDKEAIPSTSNAVLLWVVGAVVVVVALLAFL